MFYVLLIGCSEQETMPVKVTSQRVSFVLLFLFWESSVAISGREFIVVPKRYANHCSCAYRYCKRIIAAYNEFQEEKNHKEVTMWSPIIMLTLQGIRKFDDIKVSPHDGMPRRHAAECLKLIS
jgi:hypothetical protein